MALTKAEIIYNIQIGKETFECTDMKKIEFPAPVLAERRWRNGKKNKLAEFFDFEYSYEGTQKNYLLKLKLKEPQSRRYCVKTTSYINLENEEDLDTDDTEYLDTVCDSVYVMPEQSLIAINYAMGHEHCRKHYLPILEKQAQWLYDALGCHYEEKIKIRYRYVDSEDSIFGGLEREEYKETKHVFDYDLDYLKAADFDEIISQFASQYKKTEPRLDEMKRKIDAIRKEFAAARLLIDDKLSFHEKAEQYNKLRDFCIKKIPLLNTPEFDCAGMALDAHLPFSVSIEKCSAFSKDWKAFCIAHARTNQGAKGEDKVKSVLSLVDDLVLFAENIRLEDCEHDFIVVSPYGISTIEVKTLRGSYLLTEAGILQSKDHPEKEKRDVAFQSQRHIETLRRLLTKCPAYSETMPLSAIFCSGEGEFTIENHFPEITFCYYNTLRNVLLPKNKDKVINPAQRDKLINFLNANRQPEVKYDVFGANGDIPDKKRFIENFAYTAAVYEFSQKNIKPDS